MNSFENFQLRQFNLPHGIHINARVASGTPSTSRPPLFLLHGFPQSHVCWRRVAQQLQQQYFLVLPDLRGYGDSAQPLGADDHSNYSKREMAADVVAVAGACWLSHCCGLQQHTAGACATACVLLLSHVLVMVHRQPTLHSRMQHLQHPHR